MFAHIVDAIVTLAALVAILDYFGIKPNRPQWGVLMPPAKNWRLGLMLLLVTASFGMTGYSTYRSMRPKIIERIVEKPVDRVVEKIVPAQCPKEIPGKPKARPTVPTQSALSSAAPATPQRNPAAPIPLPQQMPPYIASPVSAYQELGDVISAVAALRGDWKQQANGAWGTFRMEVMGTQMDKDEKRTSAQVAQDNFFARMVEIDITTKQKWQALEPRVDAAVKDALNRMSQPGQKEITPRERELEQSKYAAAKLADGLPTAADLHNVKLTNQEAFGALAEFLKDLHEKLGDYPENSKPQ